MTPLSGLKSRILIDFVSSVRAGLDTALTQKRTLTTPVKSKGVVKPYGEAKTVMTRRTEPEGYHDEENFGKRLPRGIGVRVAVSQRL